MPTLKREALYREIWTRPCTRIAADLGISGPDLKKICVRMRIPTPRSGHWTKVECGKEVTVEPLPEASGSTPVIWNTEAESKKRTRTGQIKKPPSSQESSDSRDRHGKENHEATQPPPTRLHPLVAATQLQFREDLKDIPWNQRAPRKHFNMHVSRESLDRAIRFLNSFARSIEAMGLAFESDLDSDGGKKANTTYPYRQEVRRSPFCWISASGERVRFRLREPNRRLRITDPEERRNAYYDWKEVPSGNLEFSFDPGWGYHDTSLWKDGKTYRVEDRLEVIVEAATKIGEFLRKKRLEREEEKRRSEQLEALHRDLRRQREQEEEALAELLRQVTDHRQAESLRAYVDSVRSMNSDTGIPGSPECLWITWALARADMLDPLSQGIFPWNRPTYSNFARPCFTEPTESEDP
ncbi:hypothetical protein [Luteolibacter marinus]|uniref:hypothetical protein n=1 Tax=Luteolibacter marinus TaxID=2776705 RepID=UPI001867815A|nr:hypothetical protein [Luteolibacter marinus]